MEATPSKRRRTAASGWPELLPEIAGSILGRVTSFADRARFRSIYRQWRLAAQQQDRLLPPALPWLNTSELGAFVSLPDGIHHRLPIHVDARFCAAFDEWLLFDRPGHDDGGYLLMNPLSKATMELPSGVNIEKVLVVHSSSSHRDLPVVAAVIGGRRGCSLAFCRPGARSWAVRRPPEGGRLGWLQDIALYRGKLYALYGSADLFAYDLGGEEMVSGGAHCFRSADAGPELRETVEELLEFRSAHRRLLVVSACGKLMMVRRHFFNRLKVFAADQDTSRWSEVKSLEDQHVFVSFKCSKALRASDYGAATLGGRIFLTDETLHLRLKSTNGKYSSGIDPSFGVYDMSSGRFDPLLPEGSCDGCCDLTGGWFFPSTL